MKKWSELRERCWPGYKSVPGKKAYSPGSCVKESAAAAIAAATAIAKKKSGDYDSEGMRKTPYKNPDHPNRKSNAERKAELEEDLRKWFSKTAPEGGWKRINSKGEAIGPCAREPGEPKPKCMSNEKRAQLSKKERASAVAAKRRNDPDPERKGAPINVSNFGKGKLGEEMEHLDEKNVPTSPEKWAQAKAQAKSKFDVYPSAYANGWAAKKYKEMGGGWKSVNEVKEVGDDPTGDTPPDNLVRKGTKVVAKQAPFEEQHAEKGRFRPKVPYNVPVSHVASPKKDMVEETEMLDELSNNLLSRYKSAATKQSSSLGKEMQSDSSKTKKNTEIQNKRFSGTMKATNKQFANDMKNEAKDPGEYDQEGDMAMTQLRSIIYHAQELHDQLDENDNLPEWVQSKITLAQDYMQTAHDYMYSQKNIKEEVELTEGRPSQRHPLEGHEYHKKTNAELEYIAKDAHKAAEAMKSHNTTAENKYRDQANDSATVRYFRQKNGMPDWYKKKYGHMNESDAYEKDVKPSDKPYDKEAATKRAKIAAIMARKRMAKEEVQHLDEREDDEYHSAREHHVGVVISKDNGPKEHRKATIVTKEPQHAINTALNHYKSKGYTVHDHKYLGEETESWKADTGWKKSKSDEVTDKSGAKHTAMSRAKHLAKMAAKKNAKPMREDAEPIEQEPEEAPKKSRKAQIVKDAKKSKTASDDKFQSEPELSSTITKNY